ncbi:DUF2149 domain-containing protein [Peptococcaceae bacterium]|nr:DUF2149 domain-containing protein [Peptococcaceae bacterium]
MSEAKGVAIKINRRRRFLNTNEEDGDILRGVANLFDVAIVFAVALMVALTMSLGLTGILSPETDFTMVINPGEDNMQIITRIDEVIEIKSSTGKQASGIGEKIGTTYRLEDGTTVYLPTTEEEAN